MGALTGVRVLELGQVIAGTYGTQALADYGADVIKIEPPHGDPGRNPVVGNLRGASSLFLSMNRNKRSIVLDLKQPAGQAVLHDLARGADVVIENFRPGAAAALGADEATLRPLNPRLVYAAVSGFGADSPHRDAPSYDLIHQAMSGWMSLTGDPDRPPAAVGLPVADLLSGFFLTHGILAALYARERTGRGQRVETAMLDVMLSLLTFHATMYLNAGVVAGRHGSAHEYHVPWQAFPTADGYVVVAPREQTYWRKLCTAVGQPALADDARFATAEARRGHRAALVPLLEAVFRTRPTSEWLALLRREDVPAAPLHDLAAALTDQHVAARHLVVEVDYAPIGPVKLVANPVRFSETPVERYAPPPQLGEHTADVLQQVLGYSAEQISTLAAAGAFGPKE